MVAESELDKRDTGPKLPEPLTALEHFWPLILREIEAAVMSDMVYRAQTDMQQLTRSVTLNIRGFFHTRGGSRKAFPCYTKGILR